MVVSRESPAWAKDTQASEAIIVWSDSGLEARFLATDVSGTLDQDKIPDWVTSKSAFVQWVAFWRKELHQVKRVASDPPEFIKALQASNLANFYLDTSGSVLENVAQEDFQGRVDELFSNLVA